MTFTNERPEKSTRAPVICPLPLNNGASLPRIRTLASTSAE